MRIRAHPCAFMQFRSSVGSSYGRVLRVRICAYKGCMIGEFGYQAMTIDRANPPDVKDELAISQNDNLVTPKTFEMMTEAEREAIVREREARQEHPEWGRNGFGDLRPLSAWDRIWD